MDKALYIAMTGAVQNMKAQSIRANNLANVNTTGFKADFEQARSMPVFGDFYPSRAYALTENPATNYNDGWLQETGSDMDIAIKGDGWIAVIGPDGSERYTRVGNLSIGPNGQLYTGNNLQVLGDGAPIVLPEFEKIEIGLDGTISIRPRGQGPQELAQVDRIRLVNPSQDQLEKDENGLFKLKEEGGVVLPDANVRVVSGFLEGSNVSAIEEMINVLSLARQYEVHVKMMSKADENAKSSERILQLG